MTFGWAFLQVLDNEGFMTIAFLTKVWHGTCLASPVPLFYLALGMTVAFAKSVPTSAAIVRIST